jgi:hypothetical protein
MWQKRMFENSAQEIERQEVITAAAAAADNADSLQRRNDLLMFSVPL